MKKIKKIISLILAAGLMLALNGCAGEKEGPEDVLERFESALNEFDLKSARSCLSADLNEGIDELLCILGGGDKTGKLLSGAFTAIDTGTRFFAMDNKPTLSLDTQSLSVSGDVALLELRAVLEWQGLDVEKKLRVTMCRENGSWLIFAVEGVDDGSI